MSDSLVHFAAGAAVGIASDVLFTKVLGNPIKPSPVVTALFYGGAAVAMDLDHIFYWLGVAKDSRPYHFAIPVTFGIAGALAIILLLVMKTVPIDISLIRSGTVLVYVESVTLVLVTLFLVFCSHYLLDYYFPLQVVKSIARLFSG